MQSQSKATKCSERLLVVSHSAAMYGAERSLLTLLRGMKSIKRENILVLLPRKGMLYEKLRGDGFDCLVVSYSLWYTRKRGLRALIGRVYRLTANVLATLRIFLKVRNQCIGLVYTNTVAIPVGAFLARLLRKPHVWHIREYIDEDFGGTFDLGFSRTLSFVDRLSNKIIFNSKALQNKRCRFLAEGKSTVIYNGIGVQGKKTVSGTEKYRRVVKESREVQLLIIGSVQEAKGQLDAVRALVAIRQRGWNCALNIVGSSEPRYKNRINQFLKDEDMSEFVRFYGFQDDVTYFIENAALTLVCSRMEAFGRVAVESLTSGTPVVAANTGGLPEILGDGTGGILYESGNVRQLADGVIAMLSNERAYVEAVRWGQIDVVSRFGSSQYVSKVEKLLISQMGGMASSK